MLPRGRNSGGIAAALLILAALASRPCVATVAGRPIAVLVRPVRVEARLDPRDSGDGRYAFELSITRGADRCTLQTMFALPRGQATDANAAVRLRRTIGWRAGYLFVRTECGGGNAWKCASEAVLAIRGGRLVALGTLAARSRETGIGTSWRDGFFWDADADLEINALTSHAGAPWFEVRLRERAGRLVADRESTWAANRREFAERDSAARRNTRPPQGQEYWDDVVSPRLGNAAVAKYCGRTEALAAILAEARSVLPADLFATFQDEIAKIDLGALPKTSAAPRVYELP